MGKPWEHSTVVHAKMTWHNHAKSLAGAERHQFLLRPTEVNLLLPPSSGIVCDPGEHRQGYRPTPTSWALEAGIVSAQYWIPCELPAELRAHSAFCIALACVRHDDCTRPTLVWIASAGWDAPTNPTVSATTINVRASGRASPLFWRFAPCWVNPDAILFDLLLFASPPLDSK